MMRQVALRLDPRDNVLIALRDLRKGESVELPSERHVLASDVPAKHKFATASIPVDGQVVMYGVVVGRATQAIPHGAVIATGNMRHDAAAFRQKSGQYQWSPPDIGKWKGRTFLGYSRADGQVGTRNYWLVVPLVFCENRNIAVLKQAFEEELGFATPNAYRQEVEQLLALHRAGKASEIEKLKFESPASVPPRQKYFQNVDGIKFLLHESGCGGTHEDSRNLCGLIAGYIHHPNVAGATVLSLGCQHAQISILREEIQRRNSHFDKPLFIFEQQQSGSEFRMMSEAIRATFLGLVEADRCRREPAPLSRLCVGLKCGGSDGFSGISANPAIGHVSDLLTTLGGRTILSEFPELCGVEQELINRCVNETVADRFIELMHDYAARAKAARASFEMNPSPGNIRDGLITDAMKSAGAARKGGTSPITAVLDYPEYSHEPGLHLQRTPGNDVECVTAQVGAGASVVLFTTGLGTPTGNPISPVVKISTNSQLAARMPDIIDVDAGPIVEGNKSIEQMGGEILDMVIDVANGSSRTKAELSGHNDFIPWKRGVSL